MYAMIRSVNAERDSGDPYHPIGKKTVVDTEVFDVRPIANFVQIRAACTEQFGNGSRGGDPKEINRNMILKFEAKEVMRIVLTAVEGNVIQLNSADENKIKAAQSHLKKAIEILEG